MGFKNAFSCTKPSFLYPSLCCKTQFQWGWNERERERERESRGKAIWTLSLQLQLRGVFRMQLKLHIAHAFSMHRRGLCSTLQSLSSVTDFKGRVGKWLQKENLSPINFSHSLTHTLYLSLSFSLSLSHTHKHTHTHTHKSALQGW